jgi:hypothetical protein
MKKGSKSVASLLKRLANLPFSTASRNLRRSHFWESRETIDVMQKIIEDVVGSDRTQDLRAVLGAKLRIATITHLEKRRIRQLGGEALTVGSTAPSKERSRYWLIWSMEGLTSWQRYCLSDPNFLSFVTKKSTYGSTYLSYLRLAQKRRARYPERQWDPRDPRFDRMSACAYH